MEMRMKEEAYMEVKKKEDEEEEEEEEDISFLAKGRNLLNNVSGFALRIFSQSPSFADYGRSVQENKSVEKYQFSYLTAAAEEVGEEVKKALIFRQECLEIGKLVDELVDILHIHRQVDVPQFPPSFFKAHSDCSKSLEDALTLVGDCVNEADVTSMSHRRVEFPNIMSVLHGSILDMKFFMFIYPSIMDIHESSSCFAEHSVVTKNYPENYEAAAAIFARWARPWVKDGGGNDLNSGVVSALLSVVESGSVMARFDAIGTLSDLIKYKDAWAEIRAERAENASSKLQEKKISELRLKMKEEPDEVLDEFMEFYRDFTSGGAGGRGVNQEEEHPSTSKIKQLVEVAFEGHDWRRIDAIFVFKTFCDMTPSEELQASIPDLLVFLDDDDLDVANATALALLCFVHKDEATLGYSVCLNILKSRRIPAVERIVNCAGLFCEGFYLFKALQNEFKRDRLPKTFFNDEVKVFKLMNEFDGMMK